MKNSLWNKNFSLLILATTLGSIGSICGSYALSFLVFDETGSTMATGLLMALQIIPHFLIPIVAAPCMDRLPRKSVLVMGDLIGGLLYGAIGLYLRRHPFSYSGYLTFSLVINSIGALDALAFHCIFPGTIPEGFEDKGYAVSTMLYPLLSVLMMPIASLFIDSADISSILLFQSGMSILASAVENGISANNSVPNSSENIGISMWFHDFWDGIQYLKDEKGLRNIYTYDAVANGVSSAMGPILVAFFRVTPGFSATSYAFFTAAEFVGRSIGGIFRYRTNMPGGKRRGFVYAVQQFYNLMDGVLLWLPYPWMLINRGICGFLGINSATVRAGSVHRYIPEPYRARVNAFSDAAICVASCVLSLAIGALGKILNYRIVMTVVAVVSGIACWLTVGRNFNDLDKIYLFEENSN